MAAPLFKSAFPQLLDDSGPAPMTELQLLELLYRKSQKPHRSLVGTIEHAGSVAAHPVEWTFDKLLRPNYAIATAVDQGVSPGHIDIGKALHGAKLGIEGKSKEGFGDVLKHHDILAHHSVLRAIGGLGLDVATDPLTYASVGTSSLGKGAVEAASKAVLKDSAGSLSKSEAGAIMAHLRPHVDVLKAAGSDYQHMAALGDKRLGVLRKLAFGGQVTPADVGALNTARQTALAERKVNVAHGLHFKFAGMKTKPLPIPVPSMEKIGGAHIPLVSRTVGAVGKHLVPGYGDRITHAVMIGRKHHAELLTGEYLDTIRKSFEGVPHLSEKQQLQALHHFEKKGGVIKQGGEYVLNPKRIEAAAKAGVSPAQIDFVHRMHGAAEFLAKQHDVFGVGYKHMGEQGKLYVPHVVGKEGSPLSDTQASLLTKRGFQKNRRGNFTVSQLSALKAAGKLPRDIETNPYTLLAIAARSAAHKHADQTAVNYLKDAIGLRTKLVDNGALKPVLAQKAALEAQMAGHPFNGSNLAEANKIIETGHRTRITSEMKAALKANNAAVKGHLEGPHQQTTMATVARLLKHSDTIRSKAYAERALINEGTHPGVLKQQAQVAAEHQAAGKQFAGLQNEMKKLEAAEKKILKGKANPAYKKGVMTTLKDVVDEHGHRYAFPPEVAGAITKLEKVMAGDDKTVADFSTAYRKYLGKWKLGVTSINPGYGFRNTLSDAWNMWLAGVPAHAMVAYGGKAAKLMIDAKRGDAHAISQLADMYHHGVLSGLYPGDVQQVSHMLQHAGSKVSLIRDKRFIKLGAKITQDINRNRENWGRVTHYLYRREAEHMGIAESAAWVKKAHFDYEDLTPFEQQRLKLVAPFYTWTRKNIPYQIERLFAQPGKFAAFPKLASELGHAAGPENGPTPPYLENNMALRVPGGRYLLPMIGITDLLKADPRNIGSTFSGLASPALKIPFELAANKNLFTGQAITDKTSHPRVPVSGLAASLLKLIPGSNVGPTERGGVHGVGANPKLAYLLGQLPLSNLLVGSTSSIKSKQQGSWKVPLAYATGVNLTKINPDAQTTINELNTKDSFKGYLRGLRDEGRFPETKKHKTSKNQQILENALKKALTGR